MAIDEIFSEPKMVPLFEIVEMFFKNKDDKFRDLKVSALSRD